MTNRVPILLILAGMLNANINMFFLKVYALYFLPIALLSVASGMILYERKRQKGYRSNLEFFKGEYDIVILMMGVFLYGVKFLVPDPLSTSIGIVSFAAIILVLMFGRYKKEKPAHK